MNRQACSAGFLMIEFIIYTTGMIFIMTHMISFLLKAHINMQIYTRRDCALRSYEIAADCIARDLRLMKYATLEKHEANGSVSYQWSLPHGKVEWCVRDTTLTRKYISHETHAAQSRRAPAGIICQDINKLSIRVCGMRGAVIDIEGEMHGERYAVVRTIALRTYESS